MYSTCTINPELDLDLVKCFFFSYTHARALFKGLYVSLSQSYKPSLLSVFYIERTRALLDGHWNASPSSHSWRRFVLSGTALHISSSLASFSSIGSPSSSLSSTFLFTLFIGTFPFYKACCTLIPHSLYCSHPFLPFSLSLSLTHPSPSLSFSLSLSHSISLSLFLSFSLYLSIYLFISLSLSHIHIIEFAESLHRPSRTA